MHMETFPNVGGCSGEIEVLIVDKDEDGNNLSCLQKMVVLTQYVEYKLSHYLDKAVETMFGFVSVLPGAFSTFRWDCIRGEPLQRFLKGAADEFGDITKIRRCNTANKYLAEDRIMCLEIVAKKDEDYVIHYVPGVK